MADNKKSDYRNKWIADKLDRVNLTMPKGQKETVKAHAEARCDPHGNQSLDTYFSISASGIGT